MADFYSTVADFKTYHDDRGGDYSAFTDDQIGKMLLTASEWLDERYLVPIADKYVKTGGRDQIRTLPVIGLTDKYGYAIGNSEIPREVVYATNEAALTELTTPGTLTKNLTPNKYDSVAVSGAVSVKYRQYNNASDLQTKFQKIDGILEPLLSRLSSSSALSGDLQRV